MLGSQYYYRTSDIHKQIVLILSCNLVCNLTLRQVREVHIFKHRLYISALEQARVLILGRYVLLGVINTIYKHSHA